MKEPGALSGFSATCCSALRCVSPCATSDIKVQTGAVDANSIAIVSGAISGGGSVTLPPGAYFMEWTTDSATTAVRLSNSANAGAAGVMNADTIKMVGTCANSSTAAVFANCGTITGSNVFWPAVYFKP